jgi:hypothetical protein
MTEQQSSRDDMLAALAACIESAPTERQNKLFAAIKSFESEHTKRKTSLSRAMMHLLPKPAAAPKSAAKKTVAKKPAAKARKTKT